MRLGGLKHSPPKNPPDKLLVTCRVVREGCPVCLFKLVHDFVEW